MPVRELTLEEECILDIYNRGSRISTLSYIEDVLPHIDDNGMRRTVLGTVRKLKKMRDYDYMIMMLDRAPLWEDREGDETA